MGQGESKNVCYSIRQKESQKSNIKLLVAAIDFGTTFSGWAFSFKHEYDAEPTNVSARHWHGGSMISLKAPTTVLIKPDGKSFDSFGYDAENKYAELVCEGEHRAWYYYRCFKMMLYKEEKLDKNMKLKDETQKSLPAITVFSLVIKFMREDLLKETKNRLATGQIENNEIMWVLTVPAIWNDAAKQFMREAAMMAGIKESNFMIALEPEAASLYCSHLPLNKMVQAVGMSSFETGSKYMILDAGGGTIDITVHEVMPGCKLKEIYKATGGAWGGTQVDEAFKQFLIRLVGTIVFSRFQTEKKEDYLDIFRDFELKKKETSPESNKEVRMRLPYSLQQIFEEEKGDNLSKAIKKSNLVDHVSVDGDKLILKNNLMKSFFSETIQKIISHVKQLMKDTRVKQISSILMVGGFSESKMFQQAIKSNFNNVKIVIPQEACYVVMKGAVLFGHSTSSIAERVCKYTYGTDTTEQFDKRVHDLSKRIEYDDEPRCKDIFDKFVEVGQTVRFNETTEEKRYSPIKEKQTKIGFDIYASPEKSPMYVTDEGCVKLGKITMDICDKTVPKYENEFLVSMCFGGTEIEVTAREKRTGITSEVKVDFLG